jgi:hypothetical protein
MFSVLARQILAFIGINRKGHFCVLYRMSKCSLRGQGMPFLVVGSTESQKRAMASIDYYYAWL